MSLFDLPPAQAALMAKARDGTLPKTVNLRRPTVADTMRDMCVAQGYVPPKCQLAGPIVWGLVNRGEDPCAGCNNDRAVCGGRPKRDL